MKTKIVNLVADAIDTKKLEGVDYIDMERENEGQFSIVLSDGVCILVTTELVIPSDG